MLASFQPPASWTAWVAAPRGGELDGDSHAAAVRGSTALEAGRGAGGRKPAVPARSPPAGDGPRPRRLPTRRRTSG